MKKLSPEESAEKLLGLKDGWDLRANRLSRRFSFAGFEAAREFVNKTADIAQAESHHPDITWSYNRVLLELSTHDAGGVTDKDFALAKKIDGIQG